VLLLSKEEQEEIERKYRERQFRKKRKEIKTGEQTR